jgi:hypothetical protein
LDMLLLFDLDWLLVCDLEGLFRSDFNGLLLCNGDFDRLRDWDRLLPVEACSVGWDCSCCKNLSWVEMTFQLQKLLLRQFFKFV